MGKICSTIPSSLKVLWYWKSVTPSAFNPRFSKSNLQNEENSYKASFHRHLNTEYIGALRKNAKSYQ